MNRYTIFFDGFLMGTRFPRYMQYAALVQADVVVDEEQEICGKGESVEEVDGGSILTRGVKFTSAEEFLSFMEEDMSEGGNDGKLVEQDDETVEPNISKGRKFASTSEKVSVVKERESKVKQKMRKTLRVTTSAPLSKTR